MSTLLTFDIEAAPDRHIQIPFEESGWTMPKSVKLEKTKAEKEAKARDDHAKAMKNREGFAKHPATGYVIGLAWSTYDPMRGLEYDYVDIADMPEKKILEKFVYLIGTHESYAGFNIINYDLPFLSFRMAKYGVHIPWAMGRFSASGYRNGSWIDPSLALQKMRDGLTYPLAGKFRVSLDATAKWMGIPTKKKPQGRDIGQLDLWTREEREEYAIRDIEITNSVLEYFGLWEFVTYTPSTTTQPKPEEDIIPV